MDPYGPDTTLYGQTATQNRGQPSLFENRDHGPCFTLADLSDINLRMTGYSIATYFVLLGITLAILFAVHQTKKKYQIPFLNDFFLYMLFFYAYGFITLSTKLIFSQLNIGKSNYMSAFTAINLPLIILSIYYMIRWTTKLTGSPISRRNQILFWMIQAVAFLVLMNASLGIARSEVAENTLAILWVFSMMQLIFVLYACITLILKGRRIDQLNLSHFSTRLGVLYLVLYPGVMLIIEFSDLPHLLFSRQLEIYYFIIMLVYLINLPPFLFINRFLKKNSHLFDSALSRFKEPDALYNRYGLSEKEQEIVKWIVQGKTNEEIGDILFSSTKTIKNNITGIYKKLGVKSRVELVREVVSRPNPEPEN